MERDEIGFRFIKQEEERKPWEECRTSCKSYTILVCDSYSLNIPYFH